MRSILKSGADEILVVEWDTLLSHAAVCRAGSDGRSRVVAYASSGATTLSAALADMLNRLCTQTPSLPSQAILLSPHVQTTVLHLPVNPRKPLPLRNMQELIKWELEPYMAQHRARRIGAILVGRGYMSWADLERLLGRSGRSADGYTSDRPSLRLGELAVDAGLVTQQQVDECLVLQRAAQDFAGDAACGWTPLDDGPHDDNNNWRWLACGVPQSYRRHVVDGFRGHGLRLRAIYPLVGCARASLNGSLGPSSVVFEYNNGFLSYTRYAEGRVANCRTMFTHESGNPLQACMDLVDGHPDRVWLSGRWPDVGAAAAHLRSQLGRPCEVVPPAPADDAQAMPDDPTVVIGMWGAATHFLDRSRSTCIACVPARDPVPPLLSRRWAQATFASALATALLAGAALYLQTERQTVAQNLADRQDLVAAQADANALRARVAELNASIDFLGTTLPARQRLIPDILAALEAACPQEVTVRELTENTKGEIVLTGWGLSPQHIQAFQIALQDRLPNLVVADGSRPIRQESASRAVTGYTFELRLLAKSSGGRTKGRS